MHTLPIYTLETDCRDCYKCIRECPSKAIKITDHKASIMKDQCIFCGHCVTICPANAKKVRNDINKVKHLLKSETHVIASVAPSFIADFKTYTTPEFIYTLKVLGFTTISETALGAELVSQATSKHLQQSQQNITLSTACPSAVEYIRKYHPESSHYLQPTMSPMLAHGQYLKTHYGKECKVVFIGPCIAKKSEADRHPQFIDAALTFEELKQWIEESKLLTTPTIQNEIKHNFEPFKAGNSCYYPLEGGMLKSLDKQMNQTFIALSGLKLIKDTLINLTAFPQTQHTYIELLACEGGCINGPGTTNCKGIALKKLDINNYAIKNSEAKPIQSPLNCDMDFEDIHPFKTPSYTFEEIEKELANLGKTDIREELNCSGCGYDTCRDFANAILSGFAESAMCVSYMRQVAHNKATILIQKIPSGVIIVDNHMKVVEMNLSCAKLLGKDIEVIYQAKPGLHGADLTQFGELSTLFKAAIHTGNEYQEKPIKLNGRNYQLSIFNIQKHQLITGIIQHVYQPEFRTDIIEKRTQEVIQKNMQTVQKIAALLGENASFTDSLLNSILEDHNEI